MSTPAALQMLAFVASAFGFAWYVLRVDKRESGSGSRKLEKQQEFYFAEEQ